MYVLYTVNGVFSKVHCVLGRNTSLHFIELIESFSNHSKIESEKTEGDLGNPKYFEMNENGLWC